MLTGQDEQVVKQLMEKLIWTTCSLQTRMDIIHLKCILKSCYGTLMIYFRLEAGYDSQGLLLSYIIFLAGYKQLSNNPCIVSEEVFPIWSRPYE